MRIIDDVWWEEGGEAMSNGVLILGCDVYNGILSTVTSAAAWSARGREGWEEGGIPSQLRNRKWHETNAIYFKF